MSLTAFAFRYRAVTIVLTVLMAAVGIFALGAMSRREDPDLKARFAQIIAVYPGASAEQAERLVAEPIERTLREVDDVKEVTSTSRPGVVVVEVGAADRMSGSLDKLMDDLRERMADLRPALPSGVANIAVNDRFTDTAALIYAISRPGANPKELETSAKLLRDTVKILPEVAEITFRGVQPETVTIALSSTRLASFGGSITPDTIASAIGARAILPLTGGSVTSGEARLSVSPTRELASEADLSRLVVSSDSGTPVYLQDVATISRGYADPPVQLMKVNSESAVAVVISMRRGKNIADLGQKVTEKVEALRPSLPAGTQLTVINDLPLSVARRVSGFFTELGLAVGIIAAVMLLFMGWRSALLVGAMLPLTMLGTFAGMWLMGRDIQQMSIAALIIALALVVDNAIVILDNIEEGLSRHTDRLQAALKGAEEIRGPLLTANLVAISSFLPLAFLPGGVGDFIRDLGLVTALSLIVSVVLNLTVLPLLCAAFLRPIDSERRTFIQKWLDNVVDSLREGKATLAQLAFKRPGVPVALAGLALLGSLSLIPKLGVQFFPLAERDQFVIDVWLPEGRDIHATEKVAAQIEQKLIGREGVASVATYIGQGGPRFYYNISPEAPATNYAQLVVNTRTLADADRLIPLLQADVRTITEARVNVKKLEQGPPVGAPIAIRLSGPSIEVLRDLAGQVRQVLASTPNATSIYDSFGERPLRARLKIDPDRAALSGLTDAQIAQATRLGLDGQPVAVLRDGDTEVPIQLRLEQSERASADSMLNLYLSGGVQLRDLATLSLEPQEARLIHRNGVRTLTVFAYAKNGVLPSTVLAAARPKLETLKLPADYKLAYAGESEATDDSFRDMSVVFAVAIVFNIVVLVVQFGSAPLVLATLSAVPLGIIGAVPGLYLAHQPFGFMAFLGIAALGGLVTNHTIFLFHYAQEEVHQQGVPMTVALVDASRRRLRPILLTVLLSVGALLPQAYSGSKLWPPLDWAIIAGLLVSTFLTMIVVPSVYALLDRKALKAARLVPVATAILLLVGGGSAVKADTLPIEAAVSIGLKQAPAVLAARARQTGAGGRIDEAKAARRVTFGATAQAVQLNQGQTVNFGPVTIRGANATQANFGATATLPLDIAGLLKANVDVASLQEALAVLETRRVENETTLAIRVAYLEALRAQSLERVAKLALGNAERRLEDANKAQKAGQVPKFDVLRAETALADARQRVIAATNGVKLAQAALNTALSRPVDTPVTLGGVELAEPGGSMDQRPEVQSTQIGIQLAERGIFLARRSAAPTLGLQLAGQWNPNSGAFQQRQLATLALSLTVPLNDGGVASARKRQAEGEKEAAHAALTQTKDGVALQIEQARLNLADARERSKVAEAALAQARESSRMASVRYRAGLVPENAVSPLLEVAEAQTAEAQAEASAENARWDIQLALARLHFALGR